DGTGRSSASHGVPRCLAAQEDDHLSNDFVYINQLPLRSTLLEEQAGSADDFPSTGCIFDDSRCSMAGLFHIGMIARKPAQASVGVGDGRGNRLIHFMCERSRQLSHGGHPVCLLEVPPRLAEEL